MNHMTNFWGVVLLYFGIVIPLKFGGMITWSWAVIFSPFIIIPLLFILGLIFAIFNIANKGKGDWS
jgi:hypothetical protein